MNIKRRIAILAAVVAVVGFGAANASAGTIGSFSWDNLGGLEGIAEFDLTGTTLTITVRNTGNAATSNGLTLTGLTWDADGSFSLSGGTATASTLIERNNSNLPTKTDVIGSDVDVSDYWGYSDDLSPKPAFLGYGIATAGYEPDGIDWNVLSGASNSNINGADYAIVSQAFTYAGANGGTEQPLVRDTLTVSFTVTGTLNGITDIKAIYGTDGDTVVGVPEPTSLLLIGMGLAGLAGVARRRRR